MLIPMKPTTVILSACASAAILAGGLAFPGSSGVAAPVDTAFLKQFAETRGFMLGRPQKPKFTPDGKAVLFLRSEPKSPKQKLYEFDIATGQTKELLAPETLLKGGDENLSPEERARRERQRVTVGGFADYHLNPAGTHVLVALGGKLHVFERATGKVTELKTGPGSIVDPKWSPDGKLIGYVRGYDVFVYDLAVGKESPVTTGGTATVTHGLAEFVAQEEMHRHSGFWWSPSSQSIAYEEADHTGVEVWHVADPLKPDGSPAPQFYPRPGKKNVAVKLGVIPVEGGKTVWVEWDREKYEYLAAVRWDEHGPLTIQLQDRKQQVLSLMRVDPKTGQTTQILEEKDAAWVNIHPGLPRWLRFGQEFLWCTEAGGRPQLVGYTREGKRQPFVDPLPNFGSFLELLGVDDNQRLAIIAIHQSPYGGYVLRHSLDPRRGVQDTLRGGAELVATGSFGSDLSVYTTTYSDCHTMPRIFVSRVSGGRDETIGELLSIAVEPPITPRPQLLTTSGVAKEWYQVGVVRPRDFDPKKKYPVVVYTYGGPTSQVVTPAMQPWLVRQWLADQGFIVVAIDNRGTAGRGREWEKAVYQKFGTVPLEDQVKGLHALCEKFPELDCDRVGITGWSFGGYMAANAVLRRPDVFKAAVAGAPVTDWEDYDTHYTERYLGLLPESRKAYDEASLIPLAKDLKRPLLLVHGTADDNVFYRHTLKLSDALFRAGREFEVLPLPGVTHMVSADPVVMERMWAKTAAFFKTHLGEPK